MATQHDDTYSFESFIDPIDTHCIVVREYLRSLETLSQEDPAREHVVDCLVHAVRYLLTEGTGTFSMRELRAIEEDYREEYDAHRRAVRKSLLD